jgi:hypothetical protein
MLIYSLLYIIYIMRIYSMNRLTGLKSFGITINGGFSDFCRGKNYYLQILLHQVFTESSTLPFGHNEDHSYPLAPLLEEIIEDHRPLLRNEDVSLSLNLEAPAETVIQA